MTIFTYLSTCQLQDPFRLVAPSLSPLLSAQSVSPQTSRLSSRDCALKAGMTIDVQTAGSVASRGPPVDSRTRLGQPSFPFGANVAG